MLREVFEQKDFEIFLFGQGALQMSRISRSCIHELLTVFQDSAQHEHTINILNLPLLYYPRFYSISAIPLGTKCLICKIICGFTALGR